MSHNTVVTIVSLRDSLNYHDHIHYIVSIAGELIILDEAGGGNVSQGVKLEQFALGFTNFVESVNMCIEAV